MNNSSRMNNKRKCNEPRCNQPHRAKGKCAKHYQQLAFVKVSISKRAQFYSLKPERKKQKSQAQLKYQISDKAAYSQLLRWVKKKNKQLFIDFNEYSEFRKNNCHKCGNSIPRTGVGFLLLDVKGPVSIGNIIPTCGVCKLIKPKEKFDAIEYAKKILRRGWKKTPMASIAKQKSRIAVGTYRCNKCNNLFKDKQVEIDHIQPIVTVENGFVSLDEFAKRLYCDDSNLQILCKECHKQKTKLENSLRKRR